MDLYAGLVPDVANANFEKRMHKISTSGLRTRAVPERMTIIYKV
jgi:hypothetical protein